MRVRGVALRRNTTLFAEAEGLTCLRLTLLPKKACQIESGKGALTLIPVIRRFRTDETEQQ